MADRWNRNTTSKRKGNNFQSERILFIKILNIRYCVSNNYGNYFLLNIYTKVWFKNFVLSPVPVILATQEAELRRIEIQSQSGQIVPKTLPWKTQYKRGWWNGWSGRASAIKCVVLSSNPSSAERIFVLNLVWWYTPVISALGRLSHGDQEFEAILGYIARHYLKTQKPKFCFKNVNIYNTLESTSI
jgi:hypothetical protein